MLCPTHGVPFRTGIHPAGWALLAGLLLGGCADEASEPSGTDAEGVLKDGVDGDPFIENDAPSPCDGAIQLIRNRAWPGRGLQLTLALDAQDAELVEFESADGAPLSAAHHPVPPGPGLTVIALASSLDEDERAAARAGAHGILDALPAHERVAIWEMGSAALPISDFSARRGRQHARIDTLMAEGSAPSAAALADLLGTLASVDARWGPLERDLVLIGSSPLPYAASQGVPSVALHQVDPLSAAEESADVVATILSGRDRRVRFGLCGAFHTGTPITVRLNEETCPITAPSPLDAMVDVPCVAEDAATDAYPFGDTIELLLTPEELVVFEQFHADKNKDEFTGHFRIGPSAPIEATAHFRGSTSISCARKSLNVNLKDDKDRRVMPGTASDRFLLISMCKDDRYFQQAFADILLRDLGLFPLQLRFVRLRVNGLNFGVYLQLDHAATTLARGHASLATVIRRRFDPEDKPEEVKFPLDDPSAAADAMAHYDALHALVDDTPPEGLFDALEEVMDCDNYLRWLAFNSVVLCGDFVDEAIFYASEDFHGDWYFHAMGWDPDDLLAQCHHASKHAIPDPHGMLYCAEADFDDALAHGEDVYARFVAHLETLLTDVLTEEIFQQTLETVREGLWSILDDDETAAVMLELIAQNPDAATLAGARADIQSHMDGLLSALEARRAKLLALIQVWKEFAQ